MISKQAVRQVIQFNAIDRRISYIRIESKQANLSIINVYAPTENASDEIKEDFYEKLEEICCEIPRSDIMIILGDFNAKIGQECINSILPWKAQSMY